MTPSFQRLSRVLARRAPTAALALCGAALSLLALGACGSNGGGGPALVDVRMIAFNDLHGHLTPDTPGSIVADVPGRPGATASVRTGGAAFLAAKIDELRAGRPHAFVISTGDLIGASPLTSALFRDEPIVEATNLMGVDVNVVGNHEFDKGRAELERMIRGGCAAGTDPNLSSCARPGAAYAGARYPFLAANVVDAAGRPILAPYLVREFAGVRVGFIGVVTRTTPTIVVPTGVAGLTFADEAATVNRYVAELRGQGIEAIVVLMHEGGQTDSTLNDRACANARGAAFEIVDRFDPAVDMVFSGHTHQAYNCVRKGIPIVQGASFGRLVSVVDLKLNAQTGDVVPGSVEVSNQPVVNDLNTAPGFAALRPRADVAALVDQYAQLAQPRAQRPVGAITGAITRSASPGGDHAAGRLIADAQLAATRAADFGAARIAFMNPGGVRADFAFAPPGTVTFGQAFTVQPFGNSLVTMTLTGAQIDTLLEQQFSGGNATTFRVLQPSAGFGYAWDAAAPAGAKVDFASIRLDGQPLVATQAYRVTVNSFLADGGDNFAVLRDGTNRLGGALDIDALIAYLQANSPVAPPAAARIQRLN